MSDLLLEWLSFRGGGRADELPSELLTQEPRRILRNLSTVGHIELTGPTTWQIAPPALAALPVWAGQDPAAILCGARTNGVIRRLESACQSTGAQVRSRPINDFPSNIVVSAAALSGLAETAARAGIIFQPNAAYSLLSCVPSIGRWPRQACQMVRGKVDTVKRFSGSRAQWVSTSIEEAQASARGFFRIKRDWDWVSIFKSSPTDCSYIDDRAGRMLAAAKRRHVTWTANTNILGLPANLFPPVLIARALVLCSGTTPQFAGGQVQFSGVNAETLRLVLSITGLRLA